MTEWLEAQPRTATLLGAVLVAAFGFASMHAPVPTLVSPFSHPGALVALLITDWLWVPPFRSISAHWAAVGVLASLPLSVLFVAWLYPLATGEQAVPTRSLILSVAVTVVCAEWLGSGWRYGLEYQGALYTTVVVGYNVLCLTALTLLYITNRVTPRFWSNLAFHTTLFSWVAWSAFPWLGELP